MADAADRDKGRFRKGVPNQWARKGNGKGWGGEAKGAGSDNATVQTAPQFQPGMSGNPSGLLGERKARMQAKAYDVLEAAMDDPDNRVAVMAADKALDRIEGKPTQKVVTPDTGPEWFIAGVVEAEDMDAWQDQARLATAKPVGHAD